MAENAAVYHIWIGELRAGQMQHGIALERSGELVVRAACHGSAGDSFAGGMMGYLAERDNFEPKTLKEAMAYGILVASFTVEDFSLDRLQKIDRDDLEQRMYEYRRMLSF